MTVPYTFLGQAYADIVEEVQEDFWEEITSDGHAVATAILVAGCCIALSIDHAFDSDEEAGTMASNIRCAMEALERIEKAVGQLVNR